MVQLYINNYIPKNFVIFDNMTSCYRPIKIFFARIEKRKNMRAWRKNKKVKLYQ